MPTSNSSRSARGDKPAKPHPDFPLTAHRNGQWCKNIKAKLWYFGTWDDPDGALQQYLDQKDDSVLELACVLAECPCERTLRFLFCNEGHTPGTSVTAARSAKNRGDNIVAVFNLDGVGAKSAADTAAGKRANVTAYTAAAGERLAALMAAVNTRFSLGLEQRAVKQPGPGDDDGSFVKAGNAAAL